VDYGALQADVPTKHLTHEVPPTATKPVLHPLTAVALVHEEALSGHLTQESTALVVILENPVKQSVGTEAEAVQALAPVAVH